MNQLTADHLEEISTRVAAKIMAEYGLDTTSVALDMTNFATWVDSANEAAPLLARGRSKQKRSDLQLLGLCLVVTRDGGIPLAWHPYPGTCPDVSVFTETLDALTANYRSFAGTSWQDGKKTGNDWLNVVFDAGQNSASNFAHLIEIGPGMSDPSRPRTTRSCWPYRRPGSRPSRDSTGSPPMRAPRQSTASPNAS